MDNFYNDRATLFRFVKEWARFDSYEIGQYPSGNKYIIASADAKYSTYEISKDNTDIIFDLLKILNPLSTSRKGMLYKTNYELTLEEQNLIYEEIIIFAKMYGLFGLVVSQANKYYELYGECEHFGNYSLIYFPRSDEEAFPDMLSSSDMSNYCEPIEDILEEIEKLYHFVERFDNYKACNKLPTHKFESRYNDSSPMFDMTWAEYFEQFNSGFIKENLIYDKQWKFSRSYTCLIDFIKVSAFQSLSNKHFPQGICKFCRNVFKKGNTTQEYCNNKKCGYAYRQRKHREKKKIVGS